MNFNAALITGTQEITIDAAGDIDLDVGANGSITFEEANVDNITFSFQKMLFKNAIGGTNHPTIQANHASSGSSSLVFSSGDGAALTIAANKAATFASTVTATSFIGPATAVAADAVTEAMMANDAIGQNELKTVQSFRINDSGGNSLFLMYGAGA